MAAVNEERLTRRKLDVAFPARSMAACLDIAGPAPRDVDIVAATTSDPAKTLGRLWPWTKERYYAVRRRKTSPAPLAEQRVSLNTRMTEWPPNPASRHLSGRSSAGDSAGAGLSAPIRLFDHHACHAAGGRVGVAVRRLRGRDH